MNSRSGSLVFTINLKAKENIHAATILLYYVLQRYYLNKRHIFSKIYYHIVQQTYIICRFSHCISAYSKKNHFDNVTHCSSFTYIPYPMAFPYGNGAVLHFYQQQESSMTKTVHKVINKGLKAYV